MIPLLTDYRTKYPAMPLYLRGDSGFAAPELYETCEENDCKYAIRLKQNQTLIRYASDADEALYRATRDNQIDYVVEYGEFDYQAGIWSHSRRVVFKVEKPYGRWYICSHSTSRPWKWSRIRSFSFTAAEARWRTSSRKEKADLIFLP